MFRIGCHLSSSKGYLAMGKTAVSIGANTFQFFTRNPRGVKAKALDMEDIETFLNFAKAHDIAHILAHAPYTLNACSADSDLRQLAIDIMRDDLNRLEHTPGACYNIHPGSHVKQGADVGIPYIAEALNTILKPEQNTFVLLETMAGKGSEVGRNFEELRKIIDLVELSDHLGVCLDTCHVWEGGYDIVSHPDDVLKEFDQIIGLERLKAVHLNDSLKPLAAHKDRHARIGEGEIGKEALIRIINHPSLFHLPFYLETPNELDGYAAEIAMLKQARSGRITGGADGPAETQNL